MADAPCFLIRPYPGIVLLPLLVGGFHLLCSLFLFGLGSLVYHSLHKDGLVIQQLFELFAGQFYTALYGTYPYIAHFAGFERLVVVLSRFLFRFRLAFLLVLLPLFGRKQEVEVFIYGIVLDDACDFSAEFFTGTWFLVHVFDQHSLPVLQSLLLFLREFDTFQHFRNLDFGKRNGFDTVGDLIE